jgi:hypothetical protein
MFAIHLTQHDSTHAMFMIPGRQEHTSTLEDGAA